MPTDTDWADHLTKLEVAEPNAHETIRLAAELWAKIPPTELGDSAEAVRDRCRLVLGEYCRRIGFDATHRRTVRGRFNDQDRKAEPDRQEIVEPLKSWGDDNQTGPAIRREITSRIIASLTNATHPEGEGKPKGKATSEAKKKLPPSREKAYRHYEWAVNENSALDGATDRAVYDWLKENLDEDIDDLPNADTFSSYLKEARKFHGTQKHLPRSGKANGKTVVKQDQL